MLMKNSNNDVLASVAEMHTITLCAPILRSASIEVSRASTQHKLEITTRITFSSYSVTITTNGWSTPLRTQLNKPQTTLEDTISFSTPLQRQQQGHQGLCLKRTASHPLTATATLPFYHQCRYVSI